MIIHKSCKCTYCDIEIISRSGLDIIIFGDIMKKQKGIMRKRFFADLQEAAVA
jgi:hypothetical protein